jgi:hypothetical protein
VASLEGLTVTADASGLELCFPPVEKQGIGSRE